MTATAPAASIAHATSPTPSTSSTSGKAAGKAHVAAATQFSTLLAGADDPATGSLPALTDDSMAGSSTAEGQQGDDDDSCQLLACTVPLPAASDDLATNLITAPADNTTDPTPAAIDSPTDGLTMAAAAPLPDQAAIADPANASTGADSVSPSATARPASAPAATMATPAAPGTAEPASVTDAEPPLPDTPHPARLSADSASAAPKQAGESPGAAPATMRAAGDANADRSGNGGQQSRPDAEPTPAVSSAAPSAAATETASLRFDLPLTAGRAPATATPLPPQAPTPATSPAPTATPDSLATGSADDGLLTVAVGGDDRLDIRIGAPSHELAERVSAGLDHLRHDLRTIGAEVEAIRVEVRNERGSNASDAAAGTRQSAAEEDASDPSSRHNSQDGGSQSGLTHHGDSRSGQDGETLNRQASNRQTQSKQGQNRNDVSTSPLSTMALRLDARAGDMRVDRYA